MTRKFAAAALAAVILSTAAAHADPIEDKELSINGGEVVLPLRAPAPEFLKDTFPEVISGHAYRDPDTRAMQSDDFSNPGMVFVDSGLAAWDAVEGTEGKSCASCHNGIDSMKGVRAAMPKMNEKGDDLWSLENFVNNCRTTRMGADEWKWNSQEMKNMTAAISMQSRGMPVAVKTDGIETAEMLIDAGLAQRAAYMHRSWVALPLDVAACSSSPAPLRARRSNFSGWTSTSDLPRIGRSLSPHFWQSNAQARRQCFSARPSREHLGQRWNGTCAVSCASVGGSAGKISDWTSAGETRAAAAIRPAASALSSKSSVSAYRLSKPTCARSSLISQ